MHKVPNFIDPMGPRLRAEVERQLLEDLQRYYNESTSNLTLDWSNPCPEGHTTEYLDGWMEFLNINGTNFLKVRRIFVSSQKPMTQHGVMIHSFSNGKNKNHNEQGKMRIRNKDRIRP
jgi:hypothetical protein